MPEYIEREKVYDIFGAKQQELLKYHRYYQLNDADKEEFDLYDLYMNEVERIPTADVVEVRHGHWIGSNRTGVYDNWCCSICGKYEDVRSKRLLGNYCKWCGSKMDGKGD